MKLQHKTVVITGGGQGLGLTMAITFAKSGANIALIDLNEEQLQQSNDLVKENAARGVQVKHYVANVSNEKEVETGYKKWAREHKQASLDLAVEVINEAIKSIHRDTVDKDAAATTATQGMANFVYSDVKDNTHHRILRH